MDRILLFDGDCPACSPLAQAVDDLRMPGLHTRSLRDPDITARLAAAGLAVPAKPALLLDDGHRLRMLTGSRMRLHLVRLLGVRRGREIVGLAVMEARARREKAATEGTSLSRRDVLGATGAATGLAVLGSTLGSAQPAGAAMADPHAVDAADEQTVRALLGHAKLRRAEAAFGALDTDTAMQIHNGSEPVVAITHRDSSTVTLVGMAPGTEHMVLAMRPLSSAPGLEFLDVNGDSLGTLAVVDDRVEVAQAIPGGQIRCFTNCLGNEVDLDCVTRCFQCITGSVFSRAINCPRCVACAGGAAIRCARRCF